MGNKDNNNISAEKIKTPYYTWRKDKGFVINGYIMEDINK
jgi:hypothetical protein